MPFTEGPWFRMGITVFSEADGTVCHMEKSNPDRADNARLVAAAPDMLAALQRVARSPDCARAITEYEAVLAAVAKAIGTI